MIKTWNSSSGRWYVNPFCFAGLLGAMIEESIEGLGFNGFSIKDGNTAGGSKSHINGEKGDLRYLNTSKNGVRTTLQDSTFDYNRQVKFNNALTAHQVKLRQKGSKVGTLRINKGFKRY